MYLDRLIMLVPVLASYKPCLISMQTVCFYYSQTHLCGKFSRQTCFFYTLKQYYYRSCPNTSLGYTWPFISPHPCLYTPFFVSPLQIFPTLHPPGQLRFSLFYKRLPDIISRLRPNPFCFSHFTGLSVYLGSSFI